VYVIVDGPVSSFTAAAVAAAAAVLLYCRVCFHTDCLMQRLEAEQAAPVAYEMLTAARCCSCYSCIVFCMLLAAFSQLRSSWCGSGCTSELQPLYGCPSPESCFSLLIVPIGPSRMQTSFSHGSYTVDTICTDIETQGQFLVSCTTRLTAMLAGPPGHLLHTS
jgi:hypothetical protein